MEREKLGSRLGFILLSAGCAIGIGNVWKFPYITGQNGGGIFVLIYLLFLALLGVPVMTMEFSLGRASQKSPAAMYQELEPRGTRWHIHGYIAVIGSYLLMMFYTCVAGWMLEYFVNTAAGSYVGLDAAGVAEAFYDMLAAPGEMALYTCAVVIFGFAVCSLGLKNGLERVTKYMMLVLLALMAVLAIHSVTLPGGQEGLEFYLLPDWSQVQQLGLGNVILSAMNQSFFTLSLGLGAMAIFGSYLDKQRRLLGEAINVALLDTLVAICAGLIIFPACSAYGVEVDSGPSLLFITLPNIFNHISGGRVWGSLFFVFMSFAALSTVLTVFESIIASTSDLFGWSRKKACLINGIAMLVLSMPCVLGFNVWAGFHPLGGTTSIQDLEDFLVSNLLLPLGSLVIVLFCTNRRGWQWENFAAEANQGKGLRVKKWMYGYCKYVLPAAIFLLFLIGLYNTF